MAKWMKEQKEKEKKNEKLIYANCAELSSIASFLPFFFQPITYSCKLLSCLNLATLYIVFEASLAKL